MRSTRRFDGIEARVARPGADLLNVSSGDAARGWNASVYSMAFAGEVPSGTWTGLAGVPTSSYAVTIDVANTLFVASSTDLLSTFTF